MPEPTQPNTGTPDANQNGGDQNNNGGGQQIPQPGQATGQAPASVDLRTMSADQLKDVLENPNFYNLPRVKELRDQAAEAKKLRDGQTAAEAKALEEQGKFKELAEGRATDLAKANEQIQTLTINQAMTNKLVAAGAVDLDAALTLLDRSKLKIEDNGTVSGVDDALKSLQTDRAYLFGQAPQNQGGTPGTPVGAPGGANGQGAQGAPMKFKQSQLRDPKFYQDNRTEILAAQANGLIEMGV